MPAIGFKIPQVIMSENAATAWEYHRLSRFFDKIALHVPLFEFGSISSAAISMPPVRSMPYFSVAFKDCDDGPSCLTRHHRFCTAIVMKMDICVTKGLVVQFTARERVPLLGEPIITAVLSLIGSFMHASPKLTLLLRL